MTELLNTQQAADRFGINRSVLWKAAASGKLPVAKKVRVGGGGFRPYRNMYRVEDLENFNKYRTKIRNDGALSREKMSVKDAVGITGLSETSILNRIKNGTLYGGLYKGRYEICKKSFDEFMLTWSKGDYGKADLESEPSEKSPKRKLDCRKYDGCLDMAARANKNRLGCEGCAQYKVNPAWMFTSR
jgi:predicted DNA-binding transcriptional regulator AlpA